MNPLSICSLLIGTFLLFEQVQSESEKCMKELLPIVRKCDVEVAKIDQYCIQGYKNIDRICKENDSEDCAKKYKRFEASCKLKRKDFSKKCKPIYDNYKRECGGTREVYHQKVGPDSYRCLKVLIPAVEICDKRISKIDKHCDQEYKRVNKECKGKDTDECGRKYNDLKNECKTKRNIFYESCGSTYTAYKNECKGKSAVYRPPLTGPDSDRCLKQLVPEVQKCDIDIGKIDKYCIEEYKNIDEACKGKDSEECILRYKNIKIVCTKKRNNFLEKCTPIYKAYKTECKGESVVIPPLLGPESDRCTKELIPAVKLCDKRINTIDKYCVEGYKNIDNECKEKDTDECALKYKQFKIICQNKLSKNSKVCGVINKAYKTECTGLPVVSSPRNRPNFHSCSNELIPAIDICDEEISNIDTHCGSGFETIDTKCRGVGSVECGLKYMKLTDKCKIKREDFWKICGLIYKAYTKVFSIAPAISVKSIEIEDLEDLEDFEEKAVKKASSVKPSTSKKPITTKKPVSLKKPAPSKKPALLKKPVSSKKPVGSKKPIPTAKPKVSIKPGPSIKPTVHTKPGKSLQRDGSKISTCPKTLIRAVSRCDTNALKIDKYCSGKYKIINRTCERISEMSCGIKYKKLTVICADKRANLLETCEPIFDEYHEQCEGLCP